MKRTIMKNGLSVFCLLLFIVVVFAFIVSAVLASDPTDSDDQCDYMAPPSAFAWEGELDPNEFDKWKVVGTQPTSEGFMWVFIKNPDEESPIEIVSMAVDREGTLFLYRYFKEGNPYSYVFDDEEVKYKQHHLTQKERNSCMRCHQDKVTLQEAA